jgi:integrase
MRGAFIVQLGRETEPAQDQFEGWIEEVDSGAQLRFPDRRIYDLRSTFASRANMCHATGLTVAHLLGHDSTQILPTYVRPLDENTRALIQALNALRKK